MFRLFIIRTFFSIFLEKIQEICLIFSPELSSFKSYFNTLFSTSIVSAHFIFDCLWFSDGRKKTRKIESLWCFVCLWKTKLNQSDESINLLLLLLCLFGSWLKELLFGEQLKNYCIIEWLIDTEIGKWSVYEAANQCWWIKMKLRQATWKPIISRCYGNMACDGMIRRK